MNPLYTFGDSHTLTLALKKPDMFISTGVHSITAFRMGTEIYYPYLADVLKKIPYKSDVLVSFGEIDCSQHIYRRMKAEGQSVQEAVEINIRAYEKGLAFLKSRYFPFVLGIYPPFSNSVVVEKGNGTFEDLLEIEIEFNKQLKEVCNNLQIPFIPIIEKVIEEKWYLDMNYYRDPCHLNECIVPIVQEALKSFSRPLITKIPWREANGFFFEEEGNELQKLCKDKVCLEIGSFYGRSTICAAEVAKEVKAIDTWAVDGDGQTQMGRIVPIIFITFANTIYGYENISIQIGKSTEQVPLLPNNYFDVIFIDATHTYEEVIKDVAVCLPKIKDDGIFAFHDYGGWDGVTKAVDYLFKNKGAVAGSVVSAKRSALQTERLK